MRIVVATTVLPSARRTGGEVATQAFVEAMTGAGHDVAVLGYSRPGSSAVAGEVDAGTRSIESASARRSEQVRWLVGAVARRVPVSVEKYSGRTYRERLVALLDTADLLVADHAQAATALSLARAGQRTVLVAHNVETALYGDSAAGATGPARVLHRREARVMGAFEARAAARADQVWCLTAPDAAHFASIVGADRVRHFGLPGRRLGPHPAGKERRVGLLGTWSWEANAQGLRWFCEDVVPRLPAGMTVDVAGAGAEWLEDRPAVTYHGRVEDADAFIASSRVVAVPAVAGAGVQVKTLDALALGSWVVTTGTGLRGLDLPADVAIRADDAASFAAAIGDLAGDPRTMSPCEAALAWARPRAERFAADVASAVASLS